MVIAMLSQAQNVKFENILYGVAYYHEYMPYERLEKDVQMMVDANITVVRLGESTWSLFEPTEGKFEFAWMDRVIDRMHKAGIKVILGTPTYSIPAWLAYKHPEVLAKQFDGKKAYYGKRQNMDITNPTYLFYSERIIRKMMEHYAKHPAIIGFQVDNETQWVRDINNFDAYVGFVNFVKEKYKNLEELNKKWGLNYWGLNINKWEEFPIRDGATNPSFKLEWEHYEQKIVADFLKWQSKIVQEYKRSDQFVTQCYTADFQDLDQAEASRYMDIMSVNVYHGAQDNLTGVEIAYAGDYFRRTKKSNYLVAETNAQTTSWSSKGLFPPFDGQLRMNAYANIASGANMVEYWHWHSNHNGQETYWKGVLGHDLEPNRAYREVSATAKELKAIGKHLVNLKKQNNVAILFSSDSYHSIEYMKYSDRNDAYFSQWLKPMHQALYRMNVEADIIQTTDDFSKYALMVIPPLYSAPDSILNKISDYVKNGGHVVMGMKSGFSNEYSGVRPTLAPGLLRQACGFYYQEFANIPSTSLKGNPFNINVSNNKVTDWAEYIIPETAKSLAFYNNTHLEKYPAITRNNFGKGTLTYLGTVVSDELMSEIMKDAIKLTGISLPAQKLAYPIIVRSGMNDFKRTVRFVFNYSSNKNSVVYPFANGTDLMSNKKVSLGDSIEIMPWDVRIIEE